VRRLAAGRYSTHSHVELGAPLAAIELDSRPKLCREAAVPVAIALSRVVLREGHQGLLLMALELGVSCLSVASLKVIVDFTDLRSDTYR